MCECVSWLVTEWGVCRCVGSAGHPGLGQVIRNRLSRFDPHLDIQIHKARNVMQRAVVRGHPTHRYGKGNGRSLCFLQCQWFAACSAVMIAIFARCNCHRVMHKQSVTHHVRVARTLLWPMIPVA